MSDIDDALGLDHAPLGEVGPGNVRLNLLNTQVRPIVRLL